MSDHDKGQIRRLQMAIRSYNADARRDDRDLAIAVLDFLENDNRLTEEEQVERHRLLKHKTAERIGEYLYNIGQPITNGQCLDLGQSVIDMLAYEAGVK